MTWAIATASPFVLYLLALALLLGGFLAGMEVAHRAYRRQAAGAAL